MLRSKPNLENHYPCLHLHFFSSWLHSTGNLEKDTFEIPPKANQMQYFNLHIVYTASSSIKRIAGLRWSCETHFFPSQVFANLSPRQLLFTPPRTTSPLPPRNLIPHFFLYSSLSLTAQCHQYSSNSNFSCFNSSWLHQSFELVEITWGLLYFILL